MDPIPEPLSCSVKCVRFHSCTLVLMAPHFRARKTEHGIEEKGDRCHMFVCEKNYDTVVLLCSFGQSEYATVPHLVSCTAASTENSGFEMKNELGLALKRLSLPFRNALHNNFDNTVVRCCGGKELIRIQYVR